MTDIDDIFKNLYLDRNLASYHWDREETKKRDFNEVNPGLGIEYDNGEWRGMLGQYLNSHRKNSNYALAGYTPYIKNTDYGTFKAGLIGGAVTGYNESAVPMAGLLGSYQNGKFGLNLMAVPDAFLGDKKVFGFAGLQGRYKF